MPFSPAALRKAQAEYLEACVVVFLAHPDDIPKVLASHPFTQRDKVEYRAAEIAQGRLGAEQRDTA